MADQTFITRAGYKKLEKDLEALKQRRPVIAAMIQEAREKGDLKENAEYHAAKEESAHNERRISELEQKLGGAQILEDQGELPTDKVYIGASATVKDDDGYEATYTMVDTSESDPKNGLVSTDSPIGKALMGQAVGDQVKVTIGKGGYGLTILKIFRR